MTIQAVSNPRANPLRAMINATQVLRPTQSASRSQVRWPPEKHLFRRAAENPRPIALFPASPLVNRQRFYKIYIGGSQYAHGFRRVPADLTGSCWISQYFPRIPRILQFLLKSPGFPRIPWKIQGFPGIRGSPRKNEI